MTTYYTKEKDCVNNAQDKYYNTGQTQLIFRKGRKYIYVTGELRQESEETFKNIFGDIMHYSEPSNIVQKYQSDGYELRGWIDYNGCFKNN